MSKFQARLVASLATLPISFLAIPYVYWRSRTVPWMAVLLKPLLLIFAGWLIVFLVPITISWIIGFALIIWVSLSLKDKIIAAQPAPGPREEWQR